MPKDRLLRHPECYRLGVFGNPCRGTGPGINRFILHIWKGRRSRATRDPLHLRHPLQLGGPLSPTPSTGISRLRLSQLLVEGPLGRKLITRRSIIKDGDRSTCSSRCRLSYPREAGNSSWNRMPEQSGDPRPRWVARGGFSGFRQCSFPV